MNLQLILQKGYKKEHVDQIVNWVSDNQKNFDALLNIFLYDTDAQVVQRASWPLSYAAVNHPQLLKKHWPNIIKLLNQPNHHTAVYRNILRILDHLPEIPKVHHGNIMNACFDFIADPKAAIAVQAFALGVLTKLSVIYPEIKPELTLTVETILPNASAAFKSKARKYLNQKKAALLK